ncbi:hypothetical protein, partial [Paraburkholderia tagetis]
ASEGHSLQGRHSGDRKHTGSSSAGRLIMPPDPRTPVLTIAPAFVCGAFSFSAQIPLVNHATPPEKNAPPALRAWWRILVCAVTYWENWCHLHSVNASGRGYRTASQERVVVRLAPFVSFKRGAGIGGEIPGVHRVGGLRQTHTQPRIIYLDIRKRIIL